ncbi:MAG TPA: ATP-binding protein [Chthoniobacterales bacterium]
MILLCAGMELDGEFASRCAGAPGSGGNPWPSFGLALASLPEAHWDALENHAPLRRWRLVETTGNGPLVANRLQIDERILFFLTGLQQLDERLSSLFEPVTETAEIAASQSALIDRLEKAWRSAFTGKKPLTALQLCGPDSGAKRLLAGALAERLTINLFRLPATLLPVNMAELETLHRLWEREAILQNAALLLDCGRGEIADAQREAAIDRWIEMTTTPLIVMTREPRREIERPLFTVEVRKPTSGEQRIAWHEAIGESAHDWNGQLDRLVSQFNFSTTAIRATAKSLGEKSESSIWEACRLRARPRLQDLAQQIASSATWDDIVLPAAQMRTLQTIALHVRHRATVCDDWGFAEKSERGLGLSALFAGPSGTGKTLAAEILANELRLDLFRIDLSAVVSKYIGETEKNLRRVFDAAEEGGAILLFDEADALFGKRSEVKDSHDRYANVEISYLLQRMEAYRGLAILTTNMREALDPAFLRRLRFVIQFPFPDQVQRAEIWRRIFPAKTPIDTLDLEKLSRLSISGGNIRSIALNAAFAAADANTPVQMSYLLSAARLEYEKLEKPLTETELGGWR